MFSLWLKLLLPSAIFGCAVKLHNFGESDNNLISSSSVFALTSKIGAQFVFQIIEAEEDAPCGDESNDGLTTFETLDQATDPFGHPGPYAPGEQGCFLIL